MPQRAVDGDPAVLGQQRQPSRGTGTAGRAVDLTVGEDGDVALMRLLGGTAKVVEEDGAVDTIQSGIAWMLRPLRFIQCPFDVTADRDEVGIVLRRHRQPKIGS